MNANTARIAALSIAVCAALTVAAVAQARHRHPVATGATAAMSPLASDFVSSDTSLPSAAAVFAGQAASATAAMEAVPTF